MYISDVLVDYDSDVYDSQTVLVVYEHNISFNVIIVYQIMPPE